MNKTIEKIEALSEALQREKNKTLCVAFMTGMTVERYVSSRITTDELNQLALEYRALIKVLEKATALTKCHPSSGCEGCDELRAAITSAREAND